MTLIYNIAILAMIAGIRLAALFNNKAKLWVAGRKDILKRIESAIDPSQNVVWVHAASLGEFEQGRPVIEAIRAKYPDHKILLTFFSPSGYEIRKDYQGADYIFYLPADTARNARRFVRAVNPHIAIFIKYEFWANYLKELKANGTHTISVSSIFRADSVFFKWYGAWYRSLLKNFNHFFVQDERSNDLLSSIGITEVTVTGDTRFDRVASVADAAKQLPLIEEFVGEYKDVFVAGSTWLPDEELMVKLINVNPDTKFIIAPHEIEPERIERLREAINGGACRYTVGIDANAQVLFVDTIGILSSVYRYGKYAYIGGGFGVGIHNTLEAAAFGLPLTFGPNYRKFNEARELIASGGAVSVKDYAELAAWFETTRAQYDHPSGVCKAYVDSGRGATQKIINTL